MWVQIDDWLNYMIGPVYVMKSALMLDTGPNNIYSG